MGSSKINYGKVNSAGVILTILPFECLLVHKNMDACPICPIRLRACKGSLLTLVHLNHMKHGILHSNIKSRFI